MNLKLFTISLFAILAFGQAVTTAKADIAMTATLTYDLDGAAFANGADVAAVNAFGQQFFDPLFAYNTNQTFLEFAAHNNSLSPGRPLPAPTTFTNLRTGWLRPNSSGLSVDFTSSTLAFDPTTVAATGATGQALFAGGDSFWWGNDPIINFGSAWNQFGNLSLRYDASRIGGGNTGWLFTNNLVGAVNAFDVRNLTINATAAGPNTPGSLTLAGDLFTAPEFGDFFLIQKGIDVGNFTFSAVTAVPEPTSLALLSAIGIGTVFLRKRSAKTKSIA